MTGSSWIQNSRVSPEDLSLVTQSSDFAPKRSMYRPFFQNEARTGNDFSSDFVIG